MGWGKNGEYAAASSAAVLAGSTSSIAGAVDHALALLDRVVHSAPTSATPVAA